MVGQSRAVSGNIQAKRSPRAVLHGLGENSHTDEVQIKNE